MSSTSGMSALLKPPPRSCDTFVGLPPATADGSVVFGKVSSCVQRLLLQRTFVMFPTLNPLHPPPILPTQNSDRAEEVSVPVQVQHRSCRPGTASHNALKQTQHPPLLQEVQEVVAVAGGKHPPGASVRCTYISIPQAAATYDVILSKPSWMWGAGRVEEAWVGLGLGWDGEASWPDSDS